MIPSLLRAQSATLAIHSSIGVAAGARKLLSEIKQDVNDRLTNFGLSSRLKSKSEISEDELRLPEVVSLTNVSFSYRRRDTWRIQVPDFSLRIGERLLIVGPSGVGKSTVVDLVLGIISPHTGMIKVNGKVRDTEFSDSNPRIEMSYVPQNVYIWPGTLAQNVAFGVFPSEVNLAKVEKVLRMVRLNNWIETLPSGIHTHLGKNGSDLSGGQKQRIALARALYFETNLLVLDEPTSALDKENEKVILDLLDEINQTAAVIIVSHNPEIAKSDDFIFDVEAGLISRF
jgi:ABC-type bacteriocin/lantibiotic exporter with double-glycine peptidase domain